MSVNRGAAAPDVPSGLRSPPSFLSRATSREPGTPHSYLEAASPPPDRMGYIVAQSLTPRELDYLAQERLNQDKVSTLDAAIQELREKTKKAERVVFWLQVAGVVAALVGPILGLALVWWAALPLIVVGVTLCFLSWYFSTKESKYREEMVPHDKQRHNILAVMRKDRITLAAEHATAVAKGKIKPPVVQEFRENYQGLRSGIIQIVGSYASWQEARLQKIKAMRRHMAALSIGTRYADSKKHMNKVINESLENYALRQLGKREELPELKEPFNIVLQRFLAKVFEAAPCYKDVAPRLANSETYTEEVKKLFKETGEPMIVVQDLIRSLAQKWLEQRAFVKESEIEKSLSSTLKAEQTAQQRKVIDLNAAVREKFASAEQAGLIAFSLKIISLIVGVAGTVLGLAIIWWAAIPCIVFGILAYFLTWHFYDRRVRDLEDIASRRTTGEDLEAEKELLFKHKPSRDLALAKRAVDKKESTRIFDRYGLDERSHYADTLRVYNFDPDAASTTKLLSDCVKAAPHSEIMKRIMIAKLTRTTPSPEDWDFVRQKREPLRVERERIAEQLRPERERIMVRLRAERDEYFATQFWETFNE